eukprot:15932-Heterococcus_DN1.PRE.1
MPSPPALRVSTLVATLTRGIMRELRLPTNGQKAELLERARKALLERQDQYKGKAVDDLDDDELRELCGVMQRSTNGSRKTLKDRAV